MPELEELFTANTELLRILGYGPAKHKKTWWAIQAVKAGFHVVFIRMEDNLPMAALQMLTPEEVKRFHIIDVREPLGSNAACVFMTRFLKNEPFIWNETTKQSVVAGFKYDPANYVRIDQKLLNANCIVIVDTLTRIVKSLNKKYATDQGIDLAAAQKKEWDGYGWTGRLMDWMIDQLKALPCHVLVVAHEEVWEKKSSTRGSDGQLTTVVEATRIQPVSTSRNAAMRLAAEFTDVFNFDMIGEQIKILTGPQQNRDGGGTHIKPGTYNFDDLPFTKFFAGSGVRAPDPTAPFTALQYGNDPSKFQSAGASQAAPTNTALDGNAAPINVVVNKPPQSKPNSLASLMGVKQ